MAPWKQKVTNNFDRHAAQYGDHNAVQQQIAQHLITLATPLNNANILEIGCGNGTLTQLLAAKYPNSQIHATDISPAMLKTAQHNFPNHPNISWAQIDGEHPALTQHYDLIISSMTAQWFQNLPAALKNWQTHLKPGGTILLSRPGPNTFHEWTTALGALNLPSGLIPAQPAQHLLEEQTIPHSYTNTWAFLKSMQNAGTSAPKPGYTPLTPAQIKQACQHCDAASSGTISWHILYEKITTP